MDANFLEFWGNPLISIARCREQLDDMTCRAHQDFPGADDPSSLLGMTCGLNHFPHAPTGKAGLREETLDRFHQSYREHLKLLNVVPRTDYAALQKENDSVERKIVELEGVVGNLRRLLAGKIHAVPGVAMDEFQSTFPDYLEKLQQLMTSFAGVSKGAAVKKPDQTVGAASDKG